MTTGQLIQRARKKAGLTQSELAEKIGASVVTIGQYERNKRQPRIEQLRSIARAIGVEWTELVPEEDRAEAVIEHIKDEINHLNDEVIDQFVDRLNTAFDQLNAVGQEKAVERVEELAEIPKYREDTAEGRAEVLRLIQKRSTGQKPPEGTDTTPPGEKPSEGG